MYIPKWHGCVGSVFSDKEQAEQGDGEADTERPGQDPQRVSEKAAAGTCKAGAKAWMNSSQGLNKRHHLPSDLDHAGQKQQISQDAVNTAVLFHPQAQQCGLSAKILSISVPKWKSTNSCARVCMLRSNMPVMPAWATAAPGQQSGLQ